MAEKETSELAHHFQQLFNAGTAAVESVAFGRGNASLERLRRQLNLCKAWLEKRAKEGGFGLYDAPPVAHQEVT